MFTNCFGGTLKRKCDFIVTCEHSEMDSVHQLNAYPSVTSSIYMNIFTLMMQMSQQILAEQGLGYNIWKQNRIYTVKNVFVVKMSIIIQYICQFINKCMLNYVTNT